jgi:subtilisin family serine protease
MGKRNPRKALCLVALVVVICSFFGWYVPTGEGTAEMGEAVAAASHERSQLDVSMANSILEELGVSRVIGIGKKVNISLIDTGTDPRIISASNIRNWIDLTTEGSVIMSEPMKASPQGKLAYGGRVFDVSGVKSRSTSYRIGIWQASKALAESPSGAVGLGDIGILIADNYLSKQYDTVYIDTDRDESFSDELGLEVFRNSRSSRLISGSAPFSVVVADILDNGKEIILGFDGNGHGTSVASIIVGREPEFPGVAPAAELTVIKAVDSSGRTSWRKLADAVRLACEEGARIIVMTVAPAGPQENLSLIASSLNSIGKEYGALVIMPAGNRGPSLGTLPEYADLPNVITVGGYMPGAVNRALGWDTSSSVWPWSCVGPTKNGGTVTVVAPALSPALLPLWASQPSKPHLFEGTSCSAAYVGGVAALVQEAVQSNKFSYSLLKRAIEGGSVPLKDTPAVEQGSGLVNAARAVEAVREIRASTNVRAVAKWGASYFVNGFFDRGKQPGYFPIGVDNLSPFSLRLNLNMPEWLSSANRDIGIPAIEQRQMDLRVSPELQPGLHSGWVKGDDPDVPGLEFAFLVTTIAPRNLSEQEYFGLQGLMSSGELRREYVKVSDGVEFMGITLGVGQRSNGSPRGRIRLYVNDEKGRPVFESDWIGEGTDNTLAEVEIRLPGAGTWEIVILTDPASSTYGSRDAVFKLDLYSGGLIPKGQSTRLWISPQPVDSEGQVSGKAAFTNMGSGFQYDAFLVSPGENGEVINEYIVVSRSSAVTKMLPVVREGTKYLYLSAANPLGTGADLSIYLYHYDMELRKWVEVASAADRSHSDEELFLSNPKSGQYIAYIEVSNLTGTETYFRWTAVVGRDDARFTVEGSLGQKQWDEKALNVLTFRMPAALASTDPKPLYLTIWDVDGGRLRTLMPVYVYKEEPSPFVYIGKGYSAGGKTAVTMRAWESSSF